MATKLTHSQFLEKVPVEHQQKFVYRSEYINAKTKIQLKCVLCDYEFAQWPHHHYKKHGCPQCAGI